MAMKILAASYSEDSLYLDTTEAHIQFHVLEGDCCARTYLTIEDDISDLIGQEYEGYEVVETPDKDGEEGVHEISFLNIKTNGGIFQCAAHNEHNGYYGGVNIRVDVEPIGAKA